MGEERQEPHVRQRVDAERPDIEFILGNGIDGCLHAGSPPEVLLWSVSTPSVTALGSSADAEGSGPHQNAPHHRAEERGATVDGQLREALGCERISPPSSALHSFRRRKRSRRPPLPFAALRRSSRGRGPAFHPRFASSSRGRRRRVHHTELHTFHSALHSAAHREARPNLRTCSFRQGRFWSTLLKFSVHVPLVYDIIGFTHCSRSSATPRVRAYGKSRATNHGWTERTAATDTGPAFEARGMGNRAGHN